MAQTISQYQIAPFSTPQNGQPADADQVRGNDNSVRTGFNSHDADSGIHFQSSTLALRPAAGTANRKWYTTDGKRVYNDTGSVWDEIGYLPLAGGTITGTLITGAVTLGGHLTATVNNTFDIGQLTDLQPRNVYVGTLVQAPALRSSAGLTLEALGSNPITFRANGNARWTLSDTGFIPSAHGVYDIGTAVLAVNTIYANTSYRVGINQVVAGRQTGWTAATGTPTRTTFATGSVTLSVLAEHVKALIDDLILHGLIGA